MNLTKKTTYKADFVKAQNSADKVLKNNSIRELPIRVKQIANSFPNLKVRTYSWFAKKRGFSHQEVCNLVNSDEGCCLYYESLDEYLILYNDKILNKGRKRWTLAHELGHYVMNHNKISNNSSLARSSLTEDEYNEFESEANCFARELLAPPPVLNELMINDPNDISNLCEISNEASINVFKFIKQGAQFGVKYSSSHPIILLFQEFISKIKNTQRCLNCNYLFAFPNATFCPCCGSKNLRIEEKISWNELKSSSFITHQKLSIECPNCDNAYIPSGSNYCNICGAFLINKCTGITFEELHKNMKWHNSHGDCDELLDKTSRYCHRCGSTSTYFADGLLKIEN
ncbi:ImmA/IrrE family metallo-endopeptidase [Fictibacillus aquaticus]|nr:ImmA/IrrE family metallo-endopeptidase [Fictibacillus aquaticus]